jgi:hypothetical protein
MRPADEVPHMTRTNHDVARAYFDAVTAGELPDSLCTADMTA